MTGAAETTTWLVRNISDSTRRAVRVYAAEYNISVGEALNELVAFAFTSHEQQKDKQQ